MRRPTLPRLRSVARMPSSPEEFLVASPVPSRALMSAEAKGTPALESSDATPGVMHLFGNNLTINLFVDNARDTEYLQVRSGSVSGVLKVVTDRETIRRSLSLALLDLDAQRMSQRVASSVAQVPHAVLLLTCSQVGGGGRLLMREVIGSMSVEARFTSQFNKPISVGTNFNYLPLVQNIIRVWTRSEESEVIGGVYGVYIGCGRNLTSGVC